GARRVGRVATGRLGPLALELAMRTSSERVEFGDAASQAGLSIDEAAALWRALGFPDPRQTKPRLPADSVEVLRLIAGLGRELFRPEATLALPRGVGGTSGAPAQALVDAFRAELGVP